MHLGLATTYRHNQSFNDIVRMLVAYSIVPSQHVDRCLEIISAEIAKVDCCVEIKEKFNSLTKYYKY